MQQQINKLVNSITKAFEVQVISEDYLKNMINTFLKEFVLLLFDIPFDFEIDSFFTTFQIDKTISNLTQYLRSKISKLNLKKIFVFEGFQSGEQSSGEDQEICQPRIIKSKKQEQNIDIELQSIELSNGLEQLIQQLNEKIVRRDDQIFQMTTNYLKDIQHLKQMFLKQIEDPCTDIIEANYYDIKQSLDPSLQQYMKDKFNLINQQWLKTVQKYKIELTAITTECESHKKTIQVLLQNNTVQSIIKMLFLIEKDPFKIWKQIQDQIGNKLLFSVFENQTGGYGINYREIDELINKSSAGSRIFQRMQKQSEEQLQLLIEENQNIIMKLKDEIQANNIQITEIQNIKQEQQAQIIANISKNFEQQLNDQKKQLIQTFQDKFDLLKQQNYQVKLISEYRLQAAFQKWIIYTKYYKTQSQNMDQDNQIELKQQIKFILQNQYLDQVENSKLLQQIQEQKIQLQEYQQQQQIMDTTIQQINFELQKYILINQQLRQLVSIQKDTLNNFESQFKIIQKPFYLILQKLGYPSKINLMSLLQKGLDLDFFPSEDKEIQSTIYNYFKTSIAFQMIQKQPISVNKETITEFFDIRYAIHQDLNKETNFEQCSQDFTCKLQITEQTYMPQELIQLSNQDKLYQKSLRTSNPTNQSPKSNLPNLNIQVQTPKPPIKRDTKTSQFKTRREKSNPISSLNNTSNTFTNQIEKKKKIINNDYECDNNQVITLNKSIQCELLLTKQNQALGQKINEYNSNLNESQLHQDILVIMREESQSRNSTNIKKRCQSQNRKQQSEYYSLLNSQNVTLYEASKLKGLNKTLLSEHQNNNGFGFLPQNPFQFYQELFREKQKLQHKNYTIFKDIGTNGFNDQKHKIDARIEGKQLQIPNYIK